MKITKKEVEYVAHLARLDCSEEEKDIFTSQLNDILGYMEILNAVETAGVEPMNHALALNNVLREDIMTESLGAERALDNAPDRDGEYFRVPRVID